ncbi:MAG TPA: hypothetical protein VFV24_01325 [Candidatus Eisenbacteria bacterium]|nr:hypothetical protein [Candidatus Eisenbacteria bacterium]
MLIRRDDPSVRTKLRHELLRGPELGTVLEWIHAAPEPMQVEPDRAGIELAPAGDDEAPRRCRLKVFRAREGKERYCAFFYKRSNLPWSRDRFSYGGVEFLPGRVTESDVRSWIRWLTSGLDPEQRPDRLRRSFLYDIPD